MHDDNAYDDEDLYTEDGDFKPEFWPDEDFDEEDLEDYEYEDDEFEDDEFDDMDDDDLDDGEESVGSLTHFDMVQDDEGNWIYPEDLKRQRSDFYW